MIAPIAASRSDDIAFIVLMAGPGLIGEELLYQQYTRILKDQHKSDDEIAEFLNIQERLFALLKMEKDQDLVEQKLRQLVNQLMPKLAAEKKEVLIKQVLSPWFRFFLTFDPGPVLMKVRCAVLAVNGERDLQVPYKENLAAIEAALKAGGNRNYTILKLPNLNHLFQTSRTESLTEYGKIEETISPIALHVISDWILKVTQRGNSL